MKTFMFALLAFVAFVAAFPTKFDVSVFGERAIKNFNASPVCAQICIFNPKWARTYASELSDMPFGKEYGKRLCENDKYQEALDGCFKRRCNDKNRRKARDLGKDTCDSYGVNLKLPAW